MNHPSKRRLTDDDRISWGKYKGMRLGDIPDWYFSWFLKQSWSSKFPDLIEYAKCIDSEQDYES